MKQQKIDEIYSRLSGFSIDLPRDPTSMGPDFLREAISLCRNYLNETAHYLQDLLVEESYLAMRLDAEEATYQIRSTELLATDPRVSERPSIADRQAAIDNILREQKQSIIRLQSEIRSLGHVKTVVKNRQTELNNTMSSIRLQRSFLNDMLRAGTFYGDESNASRGNPMDPVDSLSPTDLEALVAASEAELANEEKAREVTTPPSNDPADQLDAAAFEALVLASAGVKQDDVMKAGEEISPPASSEEPETDKELNEALERFLLEPDDDVASLVERI